MEKQSGRNNIKGVDFQILSAFALFLQYLRDPDFFYIHLETPKSNDFDLVFKDGHKIICEAKNYSKNLQDNNIKKILTKIVNDKSINDKDEILIICKKYKTKTFKEIGYLKYYPKEFEDSFRKKRYPSGLIKHLYKLKVWNADEKILKNIIFSLIYELIGFWLPDFGIEKIINDMAYKIFLKGSVVGLVYKREDIINEMLSIAKEIQKNSSIFNDAFNTVKEQIEEIIEFIEKDRPLIGFTEISALTQKPGLMYLLLDKLKEKRDLELKKWGSILKASNVAVYSLRLFDLFKNNMESDSNRQYIINYIWGEIKKFNTFYRDNFFEHNISDILSRIIEKDNKYCEKAFEIIKNQFSIYGKDLFYIESRNNQFYKKANLYKSLKFIFEKSDSKIRLRIYKFIIDSFNLIADDDEDHNHYTPIEIFQIINNYITYGNNKYFSRRFNNYVEALVEQFDKYEKFSSKKNFNGWELIGSVSIFWGNNYKVSDRCFIKKSLTTILCNLNADIRWEFVKEHCIFGNKKVDKYNPDFLRRASIPIVLGEFKKNNKEALIVLKKFIFSKGIPIKADLIYQNIFLGDFSEDQKLEVVGLSLKRTKLPISPFVEMIISDLAKVGVLRAQDILEEWLTDVDYFKMHTSRDKSNIIENLKKLLESSQVKAIPLIKNLFLDKNFLESIDIFDVGEYCSLLSQVLNDNFEAGFEIINSIYRQEKLSSNQQILITDSINDFGKQRGNILEKQEIIIKIYKNFLKPILLELENNKNIENKFSYRHARESIVKFAEKLATVGKFDEALFIVEKLINDNDPPRNGQNDQDDPKGDFNYHIKIKNGENIITINTVRGWCPWVLQKFISLKGRNYIKKIVPIIYKLLKDDNYYVRVQAVVPLIELAKWRNNLLPNKSERFLNIGIAEDIKNIAFEILDNKENQRIAVFMKYLGKVFSYIRSLNEEEALHVLNTFLGLKEKINVSSTSQKQIEAYEDIIQEIETLIIFFAEFRKGAFINENNIYIYLDRWEDLQKFDDKPFKEFLINILKNSTSGIKSSFAYQFSNELPNEYFSIACKYLKVLAEVYDNNVYEHIYHFVEKYISENFNDCFRLYTLCLLKEREYIRKNINEKNQSEMCWWPYFYNGKILEIIFQKKGENEFLKWFDFLLDYPKEVLIANDLDIAVKVLKNLPSKPSKSKDIFDKLIERNPSKYYDLKNNIS